MKMQRESAIIDNRFLPCFLIVFAIALSPVSHGQEWTRFRGPNGQGISHADTIPIRWNEKDYNWKVKLPGGGHSSPVLWSDKVFITSEDRQANRGILLAISISDGNLLWQKEYTLTYE